MAEDVNGVFEEAAGKACTVKVYSTVGPNVQLMRDNSNNTPIVRKELISAEALDDILAKLKAAGVPGF